MKIVYNKGENFVESLMNEEKVKFIFHNPLILIYSLTRKRGNGKGGLRDIYLD